MTLAVLAFASLLVAQSARAPEILDGYFASGREREAEQLIQTLMKDPTIPLDVERAVGAICVQRGQPGLAARFLETAAKRHPDVRLLADLASAQFLASEFARAVVTLDGMAAQARLAPPLVSLRGLCALRLGRRDEALRYFRAAVAEDAHEGTARFYLGTLAAETGDLAAAIRHLKLAAENYRDRNAARHNLVLALYRAGRWQEGVEQLEKMIAGGTGGSAEVESLLAQGYDRLDRVQEAFEAYKRAISLDPGNPATYFEFGLMALRRRTYDLAEVVFETGFKHFPQDRNLSLALGAVYQLRGQMDRAQQHLRDLAGRRPKDALVLVYLGNSYFEAGRFDAAIEAFSHALALDAKQSTTHYQLAVAFVKLGKEADPRVRDHLRKALELDPKLAPAYYQLAKLEEDANPTLARGHLERALRLDPGLSEAHFLLARICRQSGDAGCASAALQRYEELRARERERLENDRVKGILFTLGRP
jgi:tetratricopeptide (TPR) repeat protein